MSSLIYRLFAVVEYVRATMHLLRVPGDRDRIPDTHQHLFSDRDRILDTRDRMLDTYERMTDTHDRLFGDRECQSYHVGVMTKFSLEGAIELTTPAEANRCLPSSSWRNVSHRMVPAMKPRSLASFIAGFKSATTKRINAPRDAAGTPVWQRNYYDHIIRNERSLQHLRHYIKNNPLTWADDQLHPFNPSKW